MYQVSVEEYRDTYHIIDHERVLFLSDLHVKGVFSQENIPEGHTSKWEKW